ncbi:hypothetical protein OC845_002715 [Tilletia horrida]|nr:hypothetical protein OC845_002715 [Tilletia horrida]
MSPAGGESSRHSRSESSGRSSHPRREASGRSADDDDDHGDEDADLIPLLSFTQPAPTSSNPGQASNLPPSYEDALELGPASASDYHPPVRLRSLYRDNMTGSSRWRVLREHLGSLHHLIPEPIMLCFRWIGSAFASVFGGFRKRACTYLTCACMPPQQRLSLAFASLSLVTVLLILAQPWIDTSGIAQGGITAEELDAAIIKPDLVMGPQERLAKNASWQWRRCSSEGEALRWQRKTYCTSTSSLSLHLPTEVKANDATLEVLFDRVQLDTDDLLAAGRIPPGGTSAGTAPGKIEVLVDHSGTHTRFGTIIKVDFLAKYDEDAQPLLQKSTVVVTKEGTDAGQNMQRLRILTPTLPEFFTQHSFNNVWYPHAPIQMSVKIWVPSVEQLQHNGGNDRQALPRIRIATAIADVGLLREGSGYESNTNMDGYEEEEFALKGRSTDPPVLALVRRMPASKSPSAAFFPSVEVSTLSGRIVVPDNTVLAAAESIVLRTHFPRAGVYADAVDRAGREHGNSLSSFGALRAGRGRGQIDLHGSVVVGTRDQVLKDPMSGPTQGSIKLRTMYSQDSVITAWPHALVRAHSLVIDSEPAGVSVRKGAKFVKDKMEVKGPVKPEH